MKAKITVAGVEMVCPKCGEGITAPNNSFLWTIYELEAVMGQKVRCFDCGAVVEVPRVTRVSLP